MRRNVNRIKIENNMLDDIKQSFPQQKVTFALALSYINGLAILYTKAINDYDKGHKMVWLLSLKDFLLEKYFAFGENGVKSDRAKELLDKYVEFLPKDFSSLVNFGLFTQENVSQLTLEKELAKVSYEVLKVCVDGKIRELPNADFPSIDLLVASLSDFQIANKYFNLYKKNSKDEYAQIELDYYAKMALDSEVEYGIDLADYIVRFYSDVELDIMKDEYEEFYDADEDNDLNV